MYGRYGRRRGRPRKGSFDPDDEKKVKHTVLGGVWDLYEEINPNAASVPGAARLEGLNDILNSLPFVLRMAKDVSNIPGCWTLLVLYLLVESVKSLVPAVNLWYSGQLLKIVQTAIDDRTVDKKLLIKVAVGRFACAFVSRILNYAETSLSSPLNARIKSFYSAHIFHAIVRLDLPTFDDPVVQRQLDQASSTGGRNSTAWQMITSVMWAVTSVLRLFSQLLVLITVLKDQRDGILLSVISFGQSFAGWMSGSQTSLRTRVWAATTRSPDFIKAQGLKRLVTEPEHRKEIVAGGMWEFLVIEYRSLLQKIPSNAGDFFDFMSELNGRDRLTVSSFLKEPLRELPYIIFTLRAVQYPSSIPLSLASLNLIRETTTSFSASLFQLVDRSASISDQFMSVRKLYEVGKIVNKVKDVAEDPKEKQKLRSLTESWGDVLKGVEVEFRNVSFKYPGSDAYALQNVSFKIQKGQLCVIVGANGSGKSTILKLIMRLYDAIEGEILLNGENIELVSLNDLRRAISVLFQDYTDFPLSIRDNIALGDPSGSPPSLQLVQEAARLGGADGFISRLPDGYDTYLRRPVKDFYCGLPEGTQSLFGRSVDYGGVRKAGGLSVGGGAGSGEKGVSGGQMQRLALSRTFMRSLAEEPTVGMLLFDEPSASLDPTAEHDLFERLRHLRGSKTMIFSSHRFGNLTRHADLILYMNDSLVVEEGTHKDLIKRDGDYARIWKLQAQAFL